MSTRWWLLALPLLAAGLILALLIGGDDDESVSGPRAVTSSPAPEFALPDAPAIAPAEVVGLQPDALSLADDHDALDAALAESGGVVEGGITGRLVDPAGEPVPNEKVLLVLERDALSGVDASGPDHGALLGLAISGIDGRFALAARAGRRHTVLAGGNAWPVKTVERVAAGEDLLVPLEQGYVVEGVVLEEQSGLPVPGAHVMILGGGSEILGESDADGRFALGPAPAEDVAVAAYAEGYDVALQAIAPALGPITVELPPARALVGRLVEHGTGQPVGPGRVRWSIDVEQQGFGASQIPGEDTLVLGAAWTREVIEEREAEADADGRFDLGEGPSLGFVIDAEAEGFVPEHFDRHDTRRLGSTQEIVVALTRATAWTGMATDADSGRAAAGATVVASGPKGPFAQAQVASDGRFEVPMDGWDGERPVRLRATDDRGRTAVVRVRRDEQPLELRLADPVALTVLVVDGEMPLPGAEVAVDGGDAEPTLGHTGADGTVALTHPLGPDLGGVQVRARHGARESLASWVDWPRSDPDAPVVLDLLAGVALEGEVVDPYGAPIVGAEVAVQGGPFTHSGADGEFALTPLESGVGYRLDARADGFHRSVMAFTGGDPAVRVVLDPVLCFRGRAVDLATGAPLDGTVIALQSEAVLHGETVHRRVGGARVDRAAGGTGEFTVDLPEPGRYVVQVASKDHVTTSSLPFDFRGGVEPPYQEIALPRAAGLEVTVLDGHLDPVSGLRVLAQGLGPDGKPDRAERHSARTNDAGVVRLNLGEGGVFRVSAGSAGVLADGLVVPAGVVVQRTFRTPPSGEVQVSVMDADGAPVTDCRVRARAVSGANGWDVSRRASLRAPAASVVVDRLPPGDYAIVVTKRGSRSGNARVTVVPDRVVPVVVTLPAPEAGGGGAGGGRGGRLDRDTRARLQQLGYIGGGRRRNR